MYRLFRLVGVGLLALGLASCADASSFESVGQSESDEESSTTRLVMAPAGSTDLEVPAGGSLPLRVFLYERGSGDNISGATVEYSLDTEGAPDDVASLSSVKTETDENGRAGVQLRAGDEATYVRVTARHENSNPVSFSVQIEKSPTGTLRVELINTARSIMPLQDIDVRVYPGDQYECDSFHPLQDQPEGHGSQTRDDVHSDVEFDPLSTKRRWVVTAVARGERGQKAAGGCAENVSLKAGETTRQELLLTLVPLKPSGRYIATSYWDMREAVSSSGPVGRNIVRTLDFFENPGRAIYDEVIRLVERYFGGLAAGALQTLLDSTGLGSTLENTINSVIQQNEALCKLREAGRDVRRAVANLEIESELSIGKLQSSYEFRGRDHWLGIRLYWRGMCGDDAFANSCGSGDGSGDGDLETPDPDEMPACAAIDLTVDADGKIGDLGVISADWDGRVTAYNQLQIDQHTLSLRYGRLIQYVLKEIILPEITNGNANSLSEAFTYWIGCDSIADGVTGSNDKICAPIVNDQCIHASDIEGMCDTAVSTVFAASDLLLGQLQYELGIHIGGEGTLVETDSDAEVDKIVDGTYEGYLEVKNGGSSGGNGGGGANQAPIEATWSAERAE